MGNIFFKKVKEYLFVRQISDYSFEVGKLGHFLHFKNEALNSYILFFGSWFQKWFLERIVFLRWKKNERPFVAIVGPKHIYWWFLGPFRDGRKRFKITSNDHYSIL